MMIKGHVDARPWKPQDLIDDLQKIENISYDRKEIIVREVRQCDICNRKYAVLLHYCLSYEEMKG